MNPPAHRIAGLGASLGQRVRRAVEEAGLAAPVAVSGHPLFDSAAQAESAAEAGAEGFDAVMLLWSARQAWVVRPASICLQCLRLWRSGAWAGAASLPAAAAPAPPPWLLALDGLAAAAVAEVAAQPRSPERARRGRLVDGADGTSLDRAVWPHPDCPECAAAAPRPATADGFAAPVERGPAARAAAPFMPRDWTMPAGPVRRLLRRAAPGLGGATVAEIVVAAEKPTVERGYGRSGRPAEDGATAVLEAIERYLGRGPAHRPAPLMARFDEIAERAVDPALFILPAASPSDGAPEPVTYRPDRPCAWTEAFSVRRGGAVLIPLQLAYYGPRGAPLPDRRFVEETSNGCAVGASLAEAAFYGALEVIERDAFLARWYGRVPARQVAATGLRDPEALAMLARLEAEGLGVRILDIRAGIDLPCFAVEVDDEAARFGHHLLYGAGAHPDPERALRAALVEVASTIRRDRTPVSDEVRARAETLLDRPDLVRTIDDHVDQGRARGALDRRFPVAPGAAEWHVLFPPSAADADRPASFGRLAAACLPLCDDVLVVDQSRRPFKDRGLHAAKVLAPGLLPMTFGHRNRRVSARRLERVPRAAAAPAPARHLPHMFG